MLPGTGAGCGKDTKMKERIFHQAVRYEYVKSAVDALREKRCHTILEVGAGAHGNLAQYLPGDRITFLDIELPEEVLGDPRFVAADATNLPYEENSFEFVVALDVIEHIPPHKREAFIENIHRTAGRGVVLSMPHFSEKCPYEDEVLKSFYVLLKSQVPAWIDEHIACTLPKAEEVSALVQKQGVSKENILVYHGVRRSLMQKMLIMEAAASKSGPMQEFFRVANADYIRSLLKKDAGMPEEEAMKTYIVWLKSKNGRPLFEKFERSLRYEPQKTDAFENQYSLLFSWAAAMEAKAVLQQLEEQSSVIVSKIKKLTDEKRNIRLHVVLITYNHSQYISQTLEGILMQEANFNFNIIVADDCSTDNTVDLIRQAEQNTGIQFVYLPCGTNLGTMQNYKRAFSACDAEYIAVMEGDDLWTDKKRLQKHVDFLDSHAECAMSFNRFIVKNFEEGTVRLQPKLAGQEEMQYFKYVTGHDLAYDNLIGNFSTCVYRTAVVKALPEQLYSMDCYDWLTNLMVSKIGYIGCLVQPMGIYRIHSGGLWSGKGEQEKREDLIKAIGVYDAYTGGEFHQAFMEHKNRIVLSMNGDSARQEGLKRSMRQAAVRMLQKAYVVSMYLPPVFVQAAKLLIPKAVARKISDRIF